jgi:L-asparagine transporter-like permease
MKLLSGLIFILLLSGIIYQTFNVVKQQVKIDNLIKDGDFQIELMKQARYSACGMTVAFMCTYEVDCATASETDVVNFCNGFTR